MNTGEDTLWTALRAARPDPAHEPSPYSPSAMLMRDRILSHPAAQPRVSARWLTRRRLVLAALPAAVVALAVALITVPRTSPGTARPTVATVRAAILDAWQRHAGDISAWSEISQMPGHPPWTIRRGWAYPAAPAVGQRVRFRELNYTSGGKPRDDTESFYRENAAMQQLTMPEQDAPKSAPIVGVNYLTSTWSRCISTSYPLDVAGLGSSPAAVRAEIEHGTFKLEGTVTYEGRQALKLGWTNGVPGESTIMLVDARSYEPLRTTVSFRHGSTGPVESAIAVVYALIPATPASLRVLTPPIPPGFPRGSQLCH